MDDQLLTAFLELAAYLNKLELTALSPSMIAGWKSKHKPALMAIENFLFGDDTTIAKKPCLDFNSILSNLLRLFIEFSKQEFSTEYIEANYNNACALATLLTTLLNPSLTIAQFSYNSSELDTLNEIKTKLTSCFNLPQTTSTSAAPASQRQPPSQPPNQDLNRASQSSPDTGFSGIDIKNFLESFRSEMRSEIDKRFNEIALASSRPQFNKNPTATLSNNARPAPEVFPVEKKLSKLIDKNLRYSNHIKSFKSHADNNTTPNSLSHKQFPRPFFTDDLQFISEYDTLIADFQSRAMELIVSRLETKLVDVDSEIVNVKKQLVQDKLYDDSNIDRYVSGLIKTNELALAERFRKKDEQIKAAVPLTYTKLYSEVVNNRNLSAPSSSQLTASSMPHTQNSGRRTPQPRAGVRFSNKEANFSNNNMRSAQRSDTFRSTATLNSNYNNPLYRPYSNDPSYNRQQQPAISYNQRPFGQRDDRNQLNANDSNRNDRFHYNNGSSFRQALLPYPAPTAQNHSRLKR